MVGNLSLIAMRVLVIYKIYNILQKSKILFFGAIYVIFRLRIEVWFLNKSNLLVFVINAKDENV